MSDLWYVFKDGKVKTGPYKPRELRDALRRGDIDPFDLVCKAGDKVQIKQQLIEVDEIFRTKEEGVFEKSPETDAFLSSTKDGLEDTSFSRPNELVDPKNEKTIDTSDFEVENAVYSDSEPVSQSHKKIAQKAYPKIAKKFYAVKGKGKVLGPLSASEIKSLYFKGVLDNKVKIKREGKLIRVPIAKFVALYAAAKASKTIPPKIYGDLPSKEIRASLVAKILSLPAFKRRPPPIAMVGGAVLFILFFLVLMFSSYVLMEKPKEKGFFSRTAQFFGYVPPINETLSKPTPSITKTVSKAPDKTVKTIGLSAKLKPENRESKVEQPRSAKTVKKANTTSKSSATAIQKKPKPLVNKKAPTSYKKMALVVKPSPPPAPKPKSLPNLDSFNVGQDATLSSVKYNKVQIESCPLKCVLTVIDGQGKSQTVVFFKGAFGDQLIAKDGIATMQGKVGLQGGKKVLILNSVH